MSFKERSKDEQESANDAQHRFSCDRSTTNASSRHAIVVVVRPLAHLGSVVLESALLSLVSICVASLQVVLKVLCGSFIKLCLSFHSTRAVFRVYT